MITIQGLSHGYWSSMLPILKLNLIKCIFLNDSNIIFDKKQTNLCPHKMQDLFVILCVAGSKVVPVWSWLQMGRDLFLIWLRYLIGAWKIHTKHKWLLSVYRGGERHYEGLCLTVLYKQEQNVFPAISSGNIILNSQYILIIGYIVKL